MREKERNTGKERKENIQGIWKGRSTVGREINREGERKDKERQRE